MDAGGRSDTALEQGVNPEQRLANTPLRRTLLGGEVTGGRNGCCQGAARATCRLRGSDRLVPEGQSTRRYRSGGVSDSRKRTGRPVGAANRLGDLMVVA